MRHGFGYCDIRLARLKPQLANSHQKCDAPNLFFKVGRDGSFCQLRCRPKSEYYDFILNLGVFKKDLAAADGHFEVFARLFRVCGF